MPAFHDIKEQEICAIIQKIIEPVGLAEGDAAVYIPAVQRALDMRSLIGENELGMIEIDLEPQFLFFIEDISQPIVVLGNGKRFAEQSLIPSAVIDSPD